MLTASPQGSDQLKTPVYITPSRASKSAIRAVEKVGGTVFCKYYNPLALRDCVKGRTDRTQAAPVRQNDIGTLIMRYTDYVLMNSPSVVHAVEEPGVSLTTGTGEDARRGGKMEGALEAAAFIQGTRLREAEVVVDINLLVLPLDRNNAQWDAAAP